MMFEFLQIDPNSVDPNLVYLLLVVGLWVSATAIKVPGTGVLEVIAVAGLIAAAVFLSVMPTNWWAMLLLIIGLLTFIVVPFLQQDRRSDVFALAGLAVQGAASMLLFANMTVSWLLIVVTLALQLAYFQYGLHPLLERVRGQEVIDRDTQVIGARGRVIKALDPTGTVNVDAELWTATSDEPIEAGEEIVVLERNGLQLFVERVKQKHAPELMAEKEN